MARVDRSRKIPGFLPGSVYADKAGNLFLAASTSILLWCNRGKICRARVERESLVVREASFADLIAHWGISRQRFDEKVTSKYFKPREDAKVRVPARKSANQVDGDYEEIRKIKMVRQKKRPNKEW